jgi:hypothetical protein
VHEGTHLNLYSTDEHLVDCTALTKDADVPTRFFHVSTTQPKVSYVRVKRKGRTIAMRRVTRHVPSTWLSRFVTWDQRWHDSAPPPYSGAC